MEEIMGGFDIPFMTFSKFKKAEDEIGDTLHSVALTSMKEAADEEARLAREMNEVDSNGMVCKCKYECKDILEMKKKLFENFHKLNLEEQGSYLMGLIQILPIQRRRNGMGRHYQRVPGSRKYRDYTPEILRACLEAIGNGDVTLREAEDVFGIPKRTICYKLKKQHCLKPGRPTVFSKEEELAVVECIIRLGDFGFPLGQRDLRMIMRDYLRKKDDPSDEEDADEEGLLADYSDEDMETYINKQTQELDDENEATAVFEGQKPIQSALQLSDCSRVVGQHLRRICEDAGNWYELYGNAANPISDLMLKPFPSSTKDVQAILFKPIMYAILFKHKIVTNSEKESKPMDEPVYKVSVFGASIAVREEYCQNFDMSGLPQIIDRTYEELRTCDERLTRTMPRCMFNHAMTTLVNAVLIDRDLENGHQPLNQNDYAQDAYPQSLPVPAPIHDYLRCISNSATIDGDQVNLNLPVIAIPESPDNDIHSGTFGPADLDQHECYLSPYVSMMRVMATREQNYDWQPPPDGYFLEGAVPTDNLLGYGSIDNLTQEGRDRLEGLEFQNDDALLGRLCFSPELILCVSSKLETPKDKFEMVTLEDAKLLKKRIPARTSPANSIFVESPRIHRPFDALSSVVPNLKSHSQFGSNQSAQVALQCLHLRRTAEDPGTCYLLEGVAPPGWTKDVLVQHQSTPPPPQLELVQHQFSSPTLQLELVQHQSSPQPL
ncbi:hypothetical protein GE061_015563 [Apolygus lucorum]|uniref:HTH psq-type domain-containing protein n=1 Tax=Apolygus lucorum TaxID=248454 RepID=A0A8S9XLA5_APOLU|nr:hypothetical protein GE061_015563 [Apolygus lucorum]